MLLRIFQRVRGHSSASWDTPMLPETLLRSCGRFRGFQGSPTRSGHRQAFPGKLSPGHPCRRPWVAFAPPSLSASLHGCGLRHLSVCGVEAAVEWNTGEREIQASGSGGGTAALWGGRAPRPLKPSVGPATSRRAVRKCRPLQILPRRPANFPGLVAAVAGRRPAGRPPRGPDGRCASRASCPARWGQPGRRPCDGASSFRVLREWLRKLVLRSTSSTLWCGRVLQRSS